MVLGHPSRVTWLEEAEGGERGGRPGGGGIAGDPATTGLSWSGRAGLAHAPPDPQVGREAATSALGEKGGLRARGEGLGEERGGKEVGVGERRGAR